MNISEINYIHVVYDMTCDNVLCIHDINHTCPMSHSYELQQVMSMVGTVPCQLHQG